LLAADVARGDGADYSAFHVIDVESFTQVAEYKGQVSTKDYGNMLVNVATEYNNALLVIENMNVGWGAIQQALDRKYANLFYSSADLKYVDVEHQMTNRIHSSEKKMTPGFTTTSVTRQLIISRLETYMREKAINVQSTRIVDELYTFIWNNGKAEAMRNYNDDLVMAFAIGLCNIGGKKLKVVDTDEVAYATDRNTLRDRFNRIRTSAYNQYSRDFTLSYQAARIELFRDYDTMDMDPILSSALDIYADESLTRNELGDVLVINTPDDNIKQILRNLYYDIMNIEFNLWSYVRNMCKYGDFYLRLYVSPEYGVYMIEPISAYNVTRVENSDLYNKNYIKFQVNLPDGGKVEDLENYQVAHFRLLSDSNFLPYGKSMLEGARRVWKQLSLMEDAMLIHRIMRAPEKRIFKIDVGNIPPNEIDSYMEKLIAKTKKVPYVDEKTGDYNLRFNLQNMVEDFYLPVRGGDSGTSIESLSGMEFTGTDDIEYLRKKMMAALKIPKAFLSYDEDLSGKATLAQEDVRFSRTIERIQRIIISELTKIGIVHLYAQGYRDASLVDFSLELTNPSTVFEKEKISIW